MTLTSFVPQTQIPYGQPMAQQKQDNDEIVIPETQPKPMAYDKLMVVYGTPEKTSNGIGNIPSNDESVTDEKIHSESDRYLFFKNVKVIS